MQRGTHQTMRTCIVNEGFWKGSVYAMMRMWARRSKWNVLWKSKRILDYITVLQYVIGDKVHR